jgi:hypothetical protein
MMPALNKTKDLTEKYAFELPDAPPVIKPPLRLNNCARKLLH